MSCNCGNATPKFSELKRGDKVKIVGYRTGDSQYKSKLLSMGLVRGVELQVMQVAPLGDPIEVAVLSYRLSLRKEEANVLMLERV